MIRILCLAAAAIVLTATEAAAQRVAVSIARSESIAGSGHDRGELFRGSSIRLELPMGGVVPFVTAARVQDRRRSCIDSCGPDELALALTAGSSYRFTDGGAGRLVPYVGAGAEMLNRRDAAVVRPHLHAGVDLFATRMIALRVEGQTNWSVPGNLSLGLRIGQ